MEQKARWALAYDEGGFRYGIMTTSSSESFNCVFTRVQSLSMSGIVEFSFHKCNEYFVKRWEPIYMLSYSIKKPWVTVRDQTYSARWAKHLYT